MVVLAFVHLCRDSGDKQPFDARLMQPPTQCPILVLLVGDTCTFVYRLDDFTSGNWHRSLSPATSFGVNREGSTGRAAPRLPVAQGALGAKLSLPGDGIGYLGEGFPSSKFGQALGHDSAPFGRRFVVLFFQDRDVDLYRARLLRGLFEPRHPVVVEDRPVRVQHANAPRCLSRQPLRRQVIAPSTRCGRPGSWLTPVGLRDVSARCLWRLSAETCRGSALAGGCPEPELKLPVLHGLAVSLPLP